jgi:predicted enzyme related to lactoylglutathione lyase
MIMAIPAKYVHTNLIARDWRALASFYERVFGCTPVPPERNLSGEAIERGSRVPGAALRGVHLRLPGCGGEGPTLEIFTYNTLAEGQPAAANRPGYGHIAFGVPDLAAAKAMVLAAGGSEFGDIVTTPAGNRTVTWTYVRDPEGNLVELQAWSS